GEQLRKRRTVLADNLHTWDDFYEGHQVRFATFVPPGRYSVEKPWKNEYERLFRFDKATLRQIRSPATSQALAELELTFAGKDGRLARFFVSGFDPEAL